MVRFFWPALYMLHYVLCKQWRTLTGRVTELQVSRIRKLKLMAGLGVERSLFTINPATKDTYAIFNSLNHRFPVHPHRLIPKDMQAASEKAEKSE